MKLAPYFHPVGFPNRRIKERREEKGKKGKREKEGKVRKDGKRRREEDRRCGEIKSFLFKSHGWKASQLS
jgi:hypothetical protein